MAKNKTQNVSFVTGMGTFTDEPIEEELNSSKTDSRMVEISERDVEVARLLGTKPVRKRERRSERMNLLVTPTIFNSMKEIADREDRSVNDILNELMQDYIRKNL